MSDFFEWNTTLAGNNINLSLSPLAAELIADALDIINPDTDAAEDAARLIALSLRNTLNEVKKGS